MENEQNMVDEQELTEPQATDQEETEEVTNNSDSDESDTPLTAEDRIEELEIELKEQKDKFLRLFAEFDNFKKRTAKERIELIKTAGQDIISDLLTVLDDFERAFNATEKQSDIEELKSGFMLIKDKLFKTLANKGLEAMDAQGKEFDADFHEAITEIPAGSDDMVGKVVDVIEKGYLMNKKIIRYARVVVGK